MKAPLVKKSESKRAEPPAGLPITLSEETLPGYLLPERESELEPILLHGPLGEDDFADTVPPDLVFESAIDEPLVGSLPHPKAPTRQEGFLPTSEIIQEDESVPPNLPI